MTDEQCLAIMYTIRRVGERNNGDEPDDLMMYAISDLSFAKKSFLAWEQSLRDSLHEPEKVG